MVNRIKIIITTLMLRIDNATQSCNYLGPVRL